MPIISALYFCFLSEICFLISWCVLQRLQVIWGQCCLRVASSPCLPNGPIMQLSTYLTRNPCIKVYRRNQKIMTCDLLRLTREHFKLAVLGLVGRRREKRVRRRRRRMRMDRSIVCFSRAKVPPPQPPQQNSIRLSKITCCNRSGSVFRGSVDFVSMMAFLKVVTNIIVQDIIGLPINLSQARISTRSEYRRQN